MTEVRAHSVGLFNLHVLRGRRQREPLLSSSHGKQPQLPGLTKTSTSRKDNTFDTINTLIAGGATAASSYLGLGALRMGVVWSTATSAAAAVSLMPFLAKLRLLLMATAGILHRLQQQQRPHQGQQE